MAAKAATQLHRTQRLRRALRRTARLALLWAAATAGSAATLGAAAPQSDPLTKARQFYNEQQYDQAITWAEKALQTPALADAARLVIGRSHLERFRHSASPADLESGRSALAQVHAAALSVRDQGQLQIGLGEALYLDNAFGAAAQIFSSALGAAMPADLHDAVLDWWATSLDRLALAGAPEDREEVYARVMTRMQDELARDASSTTAAYWLAAAARGAGDLETAWDAAIAGWVRAVLATRHAATLRADLDRLVQTAIIPERARTMGPDRDRAVADLQKEWDAVKANWK